MKLMLWEIWSFVHFPVIWFAFKKLFRRDVSGDMVAGAMFGAFIEFSTEPLWDYHFRLNILKDIPLAVVLGWGVMFTFVTFASELMYRAVLKKPALDPNDKRVLIFDVLAAAFVGLPLETIGVKSGIWDYNLDILGWGWGHVPVFNMPWEALVGYCLLMLVGPTYIRHWRGAFSVVPERYRTADAAGRTAEGRKSVKTPAGV